jgi:hypothetical protein
LEVNRLDARRPSAVPVGRRGGTRGPLPTELDYSPVVAQRRFEQRLRRRGCQLLCLRREVLLVRAEVRDLCRLPVAAGGWS